MQTDSPEKILIFDFDGTIADSLWLVRDTWNELALERGYRTITVDDELHLRGKSVKELKQFFKIRWYKIPGLIAEVSRRMHAKITEVPVSQELREVLEALRRKYRLGILSTNTVKNITLFLKAHDLDCFEFIHSESRLSGKTRGIKKIIKKYNFNPGNIIYVGDEIRDAVSLKKAGISVISVTWGLNTREVLEKHNPGRVVDTPAQLKDLLKKTG